MGCQYVNKKGRVVPVEISFHAVHRFRHRVERLHGTHISYEDARGRIVRLFNESTPAKMTQNYEKRAKKHRGSTLYFRRNEFVFVVENAKIVTIEIAAKGLRHLNNKEK